MSEHRDTMEAILTRGLTDGGDSSPTISIISDAFRELDALTVLFALDRRADAVLAIRFDPRERDLVLDAIHTDGVIEASKPLAGILRPDA